MGRGRGNTRWLVGAAMVCLVSIAGCGPIEYVNQVTRKASASVEAARSAGADKYSPYYYTLAKEYLRKARVEAAAADFEAANRFGRAAEAAADKARAEAIERAGKPLSQFHPVVVPPRGDGTAAPAPVAPADGDDDDDDDGGMAPLVPEDEEVPEVDPDDDEMPPGMGDSP